MANNLKNISNESLVAQYQQGNRDALKLLIQRFQPKLRAVINHHTKSQKPVEDLAQECWIAIIQKLPELNLKVSFEAWAFTIARRRSIDWIREQQRMRKQSRILEQESGSGEMVHEEQPDDALEKVQAGIQLLPASQRIILRMFYLENLSLREISKVLNVPEGTIKSRLFYARENLKKIVTLNDEDTL